MTPLFLKIKDTLLAAFNPTGGVGYHFTALRYSNSLWAPFRDELDQKLMRWRASLPKDSECVIVGSSAGYTLKSSFLKSFSRIICVDPDPLAPLIFKRRHKALNVIWDNRNYFFENQRLNLEQTQKLFAAYPEQPILISNFMGQLMFLTEDGELPKAWKSEFEELISKRKFASYHDIESVHGDERVDHLTQDLFEGLEKSDLIWEIAPGQKHSIRFIKNL